MPTTATRDERPRDAADVRATIESAFGRRDEADLVDRLRAEGLVVASLVAVDAEEVVGHALFSTVRIEGALPGVLASLAPLAVRPSAQRRGVGSALVAAGVQRCVAAGYAGVIVVGDPAYYSRFGFAHATVAHLASLYAGDAFMGLDLTAGAIARLRGGVTYPDAFKTVTRRSIL